MLLEDIDYKTYRGGVLSRRELKFICDPGDWDEFGLKKWEEYLRKQQIVLRDSVLSSLGRLKQDEQKEALSFIIEAGLTGMLVEMDNNYSKDSVFNKIYVAAQNLGLGDFFNETFGTAVAEHNGDVRAMRNSLYDEFNSVRRSEVLDGGQKSGGK